LPVFIPGSCPRRFPSELSERPPKDLLALSILEIITNREDKSVLALLAQLGERETEDLEVAGSIPAEGTFYFFITSQSINLKI
jgi:hypothetical protein